MTILVVDAFSRRRELVKVVLSSSFSRHVIYGAAQLQVAHDVLIRQQGIEFDLVVLVNSDPCYHACGELARDVRRWLTCTAVLYPRFVSTSWPTDTRLVEFVERVREAL